MPGRQGRQGGHGGGVGAVARLGADQATAQADRGGRRRLGGVGQAVRGRLGQGQAEDAQLDDGVAQLHLAAAPGVGVHCDHGVRPSGQRRLDEAGQHGARADLDEDAAAGGVGRLDRVAEPHRPERLVAQQGAALFRVIRIGRARRIGQDGQSRHGQRRRGQRRGPRLPRIVDAGCVEGRGHRQAHRRHVQVAQHRLGRRHRRRRATEHDLPRRVHVGDGQSRQAVEQFLGRRRVGLQGEQGTGVAAAGRRRQCLAARLDQRHVGVQVHGAGRPQRGQLAEAVAQRQRRPQPGRRQHLIEPGADRADPGLGVERAAQRRLAFGIGIGVTVAARRRAGDGRQRRVPGRDEPGVELLEQRADRGEGQGRSGAHADELGPLSGKHGHDRTRPVACPVACPAACPVARSVVSAVAEMQAAGQPPGAVLPLRPGQGVGGGAQPGGGLGAPDSDETQSRVPRRDAGRDAVPGQGGEGGVAVRTLQRRQQGTATIGQGLRRGRIDQQADRRGVAGDGRLRPVALLQHHVTVHAAEAEGADAGAARRPVGPAEPRPRRRIQVEGRTVETQARARPLDIDGRRQCLVVQGQHRLDQAGRSGRRLGVADLRLDAAQGDRGRIGAGGGEHPAQGVELDVVADLGAGGVRLDQPDRGGGDAGIGIGGIQRPHLALDARREDAQRAAVAGSAQAAHDGVDAVAVAAGIGQPLEHQEADAL